MSIVALVQSGDYTFDAGSLNGQWRITPELPTGFYFSQNEHKMSGVPSKQLPRTQYSVTLTTSTTTLSMTFFLEVTDCKEGFYMIRHVDYTMMGHVRIVRGNEVLEDADVSRQTADRRFCFSRGEVKATFSCITSSSSFCSFTLYSTEDVTYIALFPKLGETAEETTIMVPSAAPVFHIDPNDFVIYKGQLLKAFITVSEIHKNIIFDPPLPSEFSFDQRTHILTGYTSSVPSSVFTVTTSNDKGSASAVVRLFVDSCPEGETLLKLSTDFAREVHFAVETLAGEEKIRVMFKDMQYARNMCLLPGEYNLVMFATEERDLWDYVLELNDAEGEMLERFQKTVSGPVQRERFVVGYAIPQGATMKFLVASSVDKKWNTIKFRDDAWNEGSAGKWGALTDGKSAYFRKSFSVSRGDAYSLLQLAVTAADKTTVYLNGEEVALVTSGEEMTIDLPATYLKDGENVLAAVQSLRGNSPARQALRGDVSRSDSISFATIVFDAKLRLATSRCLSRSLRGTSTSDKPVQDRFPPENAFSDMYGYWRTQLPANLVFTLQPSRFVMPYLMRVYCKREQELRPTELRVFGRVVDNVTNQTLLEEEIAHMKSELFLDRKEEEMIRLSPKRPYNAFRVEYVDSLNHTMGAIHGLQFSVCQMGECKKSWGVKARVVGESQTKKCPLGYYGVRRMTCGRDDVTPTWEDDRSMCLAKHAKKGTAFIDTELHIAGVRESAMNAVTKLAKTAVMNRLTVLETQITFPYVVLSTSDVALNTVMRFTVEEEIGDYLVKRAKESMQAIVDQIQKDTQVDAVTIMAAPTLREPFQWLTLLVIVGVAVVAVLSFICGYFFHSLTGRTKESVPTGRKQLKRGNGMEGLLDDAN